MACIIVFMSKSQNKNKTKQQQQKNGEIQLFLCMKFNIFSKKENNREKLILFTKNYFSIEFLVYSLADIHSILSNVLTWEIIHITRRNKIKIGDNEYKYV